MQNNIISFAVIGLGNIGKRHAHIIENNPNTRLLAVIDNNPSQFADIDLNKIPCFASLEEYLSKAVLADVLVIALPNGLHCNTALQAMDAGMDVLIEKPMGIKTSESVLVIKKSEELQRKVFVVKQNRFSPPIQWLKEIHSNGVLGDLRIVEVDCFWNRDHNYYTKGSWRGTLSLDGGTLFTQFSHFIDIMYWIFGDIQAIQSRFYNLNHVDSIEFEDTGYASFEFVQGGIGSIHYSTAVWDKNLKSSITVIGSKGSVKIGGQYMNEIEYCHIQDYNLPELPPTNAPNDYGPFKGSAANHHFVIENVVNTLNGQDSISTNALEGMKVVDIIERIYAAGNRVEILGKR